VLFVLEVAERTFPLVDMLMLPELEEEVISRNFTVEETVIHWECNKCGAKSSLKFTNGSPVGLRLREGMAQHKILSPTCELDWDCITVINETD
jgi:hypothetical protein